MHRPRTFGVVSSPSLPSTVCNAELEPPVPDIGSSRRVGGGQEGRLSGQKQAAAAKQIGRLQAAGRAVIKRPRSRPGQRPVRAHPTILGITVGRSVAQPGSALASGARGREFESPRSDQSPYSRPSIAGRARHCRNPAVWCQSSARSRRLEIIRLRGRAPSSAQIASSKEPVSISPMSSSSHNSSEAGVAGRMDVLAKLNLKSIISCLLV